MPFKDRSLEAPRRQEETVAKEIGGKRVVASGALRFRPGDATNDRFLVDAKHTASKSFTVSAEILNKIYVEAISKGKTPVLQLDMMTLPTNRNRWAIIPWNDLLELIEGE